MNHHNEKHLIIVTGASRGIGQATAMEFRGAGYPVLNLSRSHSSFSDMYQLSIDLSDRHASRELLEAWLQKNRERFDQLSIIHNAAKNRKDTLHNLEISDLEDVLNLNVVTPQRLNRELLPWMKKGSAIIYIGSTLSEKAIPNSFSYVVSKHAIVGMMKATCQDLGQSGIHTACVCPGFTETEMLMEHLGGKDEYEKIIQKVKTYMGVEARIIRPQEIAETVRFCLEHPVMNGSVVHAHLGPKES